MKNKKVIFFLESQLIWENGAFGAPVLGWPDPVPKMTPVNILSNEPSLVALSQIITKRPSFENCGIQLTQLFRVKTRDLQYIQLDLKNKIYSHNGTYYVYIITT